MKITGLPARLAVSPQDCDAGGCWATVSGTPDVPAGTYTATVSASDFFVIAEPGTLTIHVVTATPVIVIGGGRFAWPTGGSARFNFYVDNSDLETGPVGMFRLTRRLGPGSGLTLHATSFTSLISDTSQDRPRIATFTGEASYSDGRRGGPLDGYTFTVHIEDNGAGRAGDDTFWIEVRDGDGEVVDEFTLDDPVSITSGNIAVIPVTSTTPSPE